MPNTSLTQAIKEAYASADSDTVILHTIELRHSAFVDELDDPAPVRVVLDNRDWTGRLESSAPENGGEFVNFTAFVFNIELPQVEEGAQPELKLTIDNVSQVLQEQVGYAAVSDENVEMTYRPYLSTDVDGNGYLNGPQSDPPIHLTVNYIHADVFQITARASFGDMANKSFPLEEYTPQRFPGLVR